MNLDDWVCLEQGEEDYVIERFEVRVKGRKPLVLNNPTFSKLLTNTRQYLNCSVETAKQVIRVSVSQTAEPLTLAEHSRLLSVLEQETGN